MLSRTSGRWMGNGRNQHSAVTSKIDTVDAESEALEGQISYMEPSTMRVK